MPALGKNRPPACILHALGYLALAAALGGGVAGLTVSACGEAVPPLDDSFIYLQVAQSVGRGHPLQYQPEAGTSAAATSLLYPLLLAPWTRLLAPAALMWAAWGLGVLFLAGSAWAADRWAARTAGPEAAWAAGLLVLASGHFVWGALSGMAIGLVAVLLTTVVLGAAWYRDAAEPGTARRRLAVLGVGLFLLGLSRPEGAFLAGVVAIGVTLPRTAPHSRRTRALLLCGPVAAVALTVGVQLLATGEPGGSLLAAKAFWSEPRPDIRLKVLRGRPHAFADLAYRLFSDFASGAYGFPTGWVLRALLLGGAALGVGYALSRGTDTSVRIAAAVVLAGLLAGLVPGDYRAHYYRYEMPYIPLATMLVVYGWARSFDRRRRWVRVALFAAVGVLLLPGLWRYVDRYPRNASDILGHQVTMGRWIDANLPSDARVAINDAGAIAYYGHRPVVDLVGLVTPSAACSFRAGQGAVFEWLESLPPKARPTHFAVFPAWFPYLVHTHLVGRKLLQLTLANRTISGGVVKSVFEADWSRVRSDDPPVARGDLLALWGFVVSDALDVGDLEDQRAHGYEAFDTWRDILREYAVEGHPETVLIDGGRLPTRGERFRMFCFPGEPAALVMRTESFVGFTLRVRVNGRDLGTWTVPRQALVWTEPLFEIPGEALTGDSAEIELTLVDMTWPYPSYQYWLLQ